MRSSRSLRACARIALAVAALAAAPADPGRAATGCPAPIGLVDNDAPDAVVGSGTPASCSGAALAAAVAAGGIVVFDCGPDPVTIPIAATLVATHDTVIDGGHRVTLDGGDAIRILAVPSSFELGTPTLTVQRLAFARGRSGAGGGGDTERGGGAIWLRGGSLEVVDCSFTDNHGPATGQDVAGGAVYDVGAGHVTIVGSHFSGNGASNGGALGILHADLTVVDTLIADNAATGSGGNPGNGGNGGGVYIDGVSQDVSLCGVTLAGNRAEAFGGGLFRVSNDGVGAMGIDRSSVLSNAVPDHSPSSAGGLYLQGVQIEMRRSTVAWNQARFAGGLFIGPNGTTLEVENTTIAENTALSGLAGGMAISDGVTGRVRNATLARNAAPGALAFAAATTGGGGMQLQNTLVDGHVVGNGWNPVSCRDAFQEGGGNLQWPVARAGGGSDDPDALCSPAVTIADVRLGSLQDNGGPTPTALPAPDSPALGLGSDCPAADQRGLPRDPSRCTAGAVEPAPEPDPGPLAALALAALAALARGPGRRAGRRYSGMRRSQPRRGGSGSEAGSARPDAIARRSEP